MQALKKVEANKGSCGVDGMETSELRAYFKSNPGKLTEQILQGTFRKGPANRIWNVGMFTGTALVPNGMPGGVRGTGNNRPYSILLIKLLEKQVFFLSHIESAHSYPSRFGL